MRIAVFTSNQPRHLSLLNTLTMAGHDVVAIIEPKSWTPGYRSELLTAYWQHVHDAERREFGDVKLATVPALAVPAGEVSRLHPSDLPHAVRFADRVLVFSASYIVGPLLEWLQARAVIHLHVGLAPEYRGSAPNAWAQYDGNPHLIGAQVQTLDKVLDGGLILAEYRPSPDGDYWARGMRAVRGGIDDLVRLASVPPSAWAPVRVNDATGLVRYSKHSDFTEEIAAKIMETAG